MKISTTSKIIPILLFALSLPMGLLILTGFVQASQGTVVEIIPNEISAGVDQSFTINVTIVGVQNLYGLDVTINWNSSVLQLVNIDVRLGHTSTDGVLCNSSSTSSPYIVVNSTLDGQYEIAATSEAPAPSFNGTGNIVRITFKVIDSGNSKINLESQLQDYPPPDREPRISLPIQHSTIGGLFSATVAEIPNAAIFIAFALLTASALVISKKTKRKCAHTPGLGDPRQDLLTEEKA